MNINEFHPTSGRFVKEDGTTDINRYIVECKDNYGESFEDISKY